MLVSFKLEVKRNLEITADLKGNGQEIRKDVDLLLDDILNRR